MAEGSRLRPVRLHLGPPWKVTCASATLVGGVALVATGATIPELWWALAMEVVGYVLLAATPALIYDAALSGVQRHMLAGMLDSLRREGTPESHRMATEIETELAERGWPHRYVDEA
jgi:hypothetical protein